MVSLKFEWVSKDFKDCVCVCEKVLVGCEKKKERAAMFTSYIAPSSVRSPASPLKGSYSRTGASSERNGALKEDEREEG